MLQMLTDRTGGKSDASAPHSLQGWQSTLLDERDSGNNSPCRDLDNVARFSLHTVEFFSLASGGPARYTGREIRAAHKGMKISNAEFHAMVRDPKTSMDRLRIAPREKRDVMAIIGTTRKEIVEKQ